MMRFVGPVCLLVLGGFGWALLKARVRVLPAQVEPSASDSEPSSLSDVGERLRSIDQLRERDGITAFEHAEQRRRILDSV